MRPSSRRPGSGSGSAGDAEGEHRGDQPEGIDRLVRGVGEHDDRADRDADQHLHHGEQRVGARCDPESILIH